MAEYDTTVIINGETAVTTALYDTEIQLLLAYFNELIDIHKQNIAKESDK